VIQKIQRDGALNFAAPEGHSPRSSKICGPIGKHSPLWFRVGGMQDSSFVIAGGQAPE